MTNDIPMNDAHQPDWQCALVLQPHVVVKVKSFYEISVTSSTNGQLPYSNSLYRLGSNSVGTFPKYTRYNFLIVFSG